MNRQSVFLFTVLFVVVAASAQGGEVLVLRVDPREVRRQLRAHAGDPLRVAEEVLGAQVEPAVGLPGPGQAQRAGEDPDAGQ